MTAARKRVTIAVDAADRQVPPRPLPPLSPHRHQNDLLPTHSSSSCCVLLLCQKALQYEPHFNPNKHPVFTYILLEWLTLTEHCTCADFKFRRFNCGRNISPWIEAAGHQSYNRQVGVLLDTSIKDTADNLDTSQHASFRCYLDFPFEGSLMHP